MKTSVVTAVLAMLASDMQATSVPRVKKAQYTSHNGLDTQAELIEQAKVKRYRKNSRRLAEAQKQENTYHGNSR